MSLFFLRKEVIMAKYDKQPSNSDYNKKPKDPKSDKPEKKSPPPMPMRGLAVSFLLMAIFLTVLHLFSNSSKSSNEIEYSDFINMVKGGRISRWILRTTGQATTM